MLRLSRFPFKPVAHCFVLGVALRCVVLASPVAEEPARPRITSIDHVAIYVSDVEKSRRFYSDVLGLTVGCPQYSGADTCLLVRPSAQRILLRAAPAEIRNHAHQSWLAEIAFATDEVSGARRYLLAHGFHPEPIQRDSDGAESFRVRDPEGNAIVFVHRPASEAGHGPASQQIASRMIHAGFVVKDMAAENRFYVDVLGFRLYWRGGFKDDGTDWYELQVPEGPDWIEYMLNIPADADHKKLGCRIIFSLA